MERTRSRFTAPGPTTEHGFFHKKIFGGIKGAIGGFLSGGPVGALGGAVKGVLGGGGGGGRVAAPTPIVRVQPAAQAIPAQTGCPPGFFLQNGNCIQRQMSAPVVPTPGIIGFGQRFLPGGATGFQVPLPVAPPAAPPAARPQAGFGNAVMGQFGAALEPAVRSSDVRVCPRGTVLGVDGLCYNRRDISNSQRWWPRGRRPLLTGGEMRCITVAASAAKKLKTKTRQLESLGLLKKAAPRRRLPAGHGAKLTHD